ncbi:MAG: DNA pilot protein [Microviridae sp.]|nr:MAG: DNA pilot protein [Microviridae sp.]
MDPISALIGAGSSLLGGIFNRQSAEEMQQKNLAQQLAFAQNRIQWTVNDAKAAGINPLAALGNATQTYSNIAGDSSLGDSIAAAGQNLSRSIAAGSDKESKLDQLNAKLIESKIRNVDADTLQKTADASDRVRAVQPGDPPGVSVPFPPEDPRGPVINLYQRARDTDGSIVLIPSEKAASPLQTLAATPTNAAMAGRGTFHTMVGVDNPWGDSGGHSRTSARYSNDRSQLDYLGQ